MFEELKILAQNGQQFIPDLTTAKIPSPFRGRPEISHAKVNIDELVACCPVDAISASPTSIDLGKCVFCGECAIAFPEKIKFTKDHRIASNERERLIIKEGETSEIIINPDKIRAEIKKVFKHSLKLRQVSAGGDNSCEYELNACGNPNFDMGRFGVEFVASPRHADGIVVTGPITKNMAEALQVCYDAIPDPKIIVLCGTDAISGGIFNDGAALNREFLDKYYVDLYIPGNPPHPLTIINGILELTRNNK